MREEERGRGREREREREMSLLPLDTMAPVSPFVEVSLFSFRWTIAE